MTNYNEFTPVAINPIYVNGLVELVALCRAHNVEVTKVQFFQNGFRVEFEVDDGDAILHDGSYGRNDGTWETIGFPWDGDDVSCHDSDTLAKMLNALKTGEDWEQYDC